MNARLLFEIKAEGDLVVYQEKKSQVDKEISKALTHFPNVWWADERWRDDLKCYWKKMNKGVNASTSYDDLVAEETAYMDEDELDIYHAQYSVNENVNQEKFENESDAIPEPGSPEAKELRKILNSISSKAEKLFQIIIDDAKEKASQEDIALANSLNKEIQETIESSSAFSAKQIRISLNRVSRSVFENNAKEDGLLKACFFGYAYDREIDRWMNSRVWDYDGNSADTVDFENCYEESFELDKIIKEANSIIETMSKDDCPCVETIRRIDKLTKSLDALEEDQRMRFIAQMFYQQANALQDDESEYPSPKEIAEVFVSNDELPFCDEQKPPKVNASCLFEESDELPF